MLDKFYLSVPAVLPVLNARKGVVLDDEGRDREARALYRRALAMAANNPMLRSHLKLSIVLAEAGNRYTVGHYQPPSQTVLIAMAESRE